MPRVRWCSRPLPVLCLFGFWIVATASADCWYGDRVHEEGVEVATAEPCLNCTCSRGALLCYLRVCTPLPNPPPPGCVLLHRYRTCCPELICTDLLYGGNGLESRAEPDDLELPDRTILDNACIANGSIYGPGSAMDSSSLCEYCYCLAGKQTCVKPKCLLPIEGCVPMYEPTNCCPVHYNCSYDTSSTTSTTTTSPKQIDTIGGCMVDGVRHPEGGKVLGVGHSVCDNCYCLRGVLRCEPLSCAPPLLGCVPVVRPGECCAASYNCSGTIEIQPEPNYGHYPIVSKEYAKLRKEVQHNSQTATQNPNLPFYVIAETSKTTTKTQRSPTSFGTTRHFTGTSFAPITTKPVYYNSMVEENKFEGAGLSGQPTTTTTVYNNKLRSTDYDDILFSIVDSLIDNRLNRRVENQNKTETTTIPTTTSEPSTSTVTESTDTTFIDSTTDATTTEDRMTTVTEPALVTLKTVLNSTDCIEDRQVLHKFDVTTVLPVDANEINTLKELDYTGTSSEESSVGTTSSEDRTEVDLESKVKVASATLPNSPKISLAMETILKNKEEDYEYDYNEPTLPPSLPNLRIIPFVAADALDTNQDLPSAVYSPQQRVTDPPFGFTNLFSPPIETEGGFIPKQPPILDNFYANIICQEMPCPLPRPGCRKAPGQDLTVCCPSYICDDDEAPTVVLDPLQVLEALSGTSNSQQEPVTVADRMKTPDPFRDVIHTEPPPALQSLIVDMISRQTTQMPPAYTAPPNLTDLMTVNKTDAADESSDDDQFSLNKVLQLLFFNQKEQQQQQQQHKTTIEQIQITTAASTKLTAAPALSIYEKTNLHTATVDPRQQMETRENLNSELNRVDSSGSMGPLKLAGCNIYGRMYRVDRVISELSSPCLECKCTETGVQCRKLKC